MLEGGVNNGYLWCYSLHLAPALCSLHIGAMGARCRTKHAQLLKESELSLTWALACGVDPASCELQAASCKVTKKSSLAPVVPILRAASCELRACEQQRSRASDLCRMTPGSSYSVSVVVCPRSSAPEPRSEGRPSRSCDAAARRCCRFQGEGGYCLGQDLSPELSASTYPVSVPRTAGGRNISAGPGF